MSDHEPTTETNVSPYNPSIEQPISIYDTTLRDGEQAPNVALTADEKIDIAHRLSAAGIPEIEVGFPAVSAQEHRATETIAHMDLDADIIALARTKQEDVKAAIDAGVDRVIIVVPTSDRHLNTKTDCAVSTIHRRVQQLTTQAIDHGLAVSVSAEDATRAPVERLRSLATAAEAAGATRIHLPDTVGAATPTAIQHVVAAINRVINPETELCVHCHDDCGLAVANTLAGFRAGADIGAVTVNGIGERAGNAALEEVVIAVQTLYDGDLDIDTTMLPELSRMVAERTGLTVAETKPVVGKHCFVHESGIHVDAMLEDPATYEALNPTAIGRDREITLGKHSGQSAIEWAHDQQASNNMRQE